MKTDSSIFLRFFNCGFVIISMLSVSCKKAEDRHCFKSTGKEAKREIALTAFDKMELNDKINYVLVQDSINKVVLLGGSNVIKDIDVLIDESTLTIRNKNKCNFLRSYKKKISAEIHFTSLTYLDYRGTEKLVNEGVFNFDSFSLSIVDGNSGTVDLNLSGNQLRAVVAGGYGDFRFSGNVNYANLQLQSNGYCDTYALDINDSITVVSNTMGLMKINADGTELRAEIKSGGDIWYKGQTTIQQINRYGKGELIHKD